MSEVATAPALADGGLRDEVEQFLVDEAELIDAGEFEQWLGLFTDDATYRIPYDDEPGGPRRIHIVRDDRRRLGERVQRMVSGVSFVQTPPSQTFHLVGNVRVADGPDGSLTVRSKQMIGEFRRGKQTLYAAACEHTLVRTGDGLRIKAKAVVLLNRTQPLYDLTFIL